MLVLEGDRATLIAKVLWRALGRRKALAVALAIRRIARREDQVARSGSDWITPIDPPPGQEAWNPKIGNPKSTSGPEFREINPLQDDASAVVEQLRPRAKRGAAIGTGE